MRCNVRCRWGLAVIATVVMVGCGGNSTDKTSDNATGTPTASQQQSSEPPPEPTGPEPTQSSQKRPSLNVARLPLGGGTDSPVEDRLQCAEAAWLGSRPLPAGVIVRVRAIKLSPAGVFRLDQRGCGDRQPCPGMRWEGQKALDACFIGARQVTAGAGDVNRVSVSLRGTISCDQLQDCRRALEQTGSDSLTFSPDPHFGEPTEGPPTDSPPPEDPTEVPTEGPLTESPATPTG
ncbi:hypothetical protein GCM10009789_65760 [Kribbella sancticallisti]|uniref:Uncharacterized protein n=1 Tax=Kribbella sancticallisti TaxID=460087 RepID=A0ABN2EBM5_9ACTN